MNYAEVFNQYLKNPVKYDFSFISKHEDFINKSSNFYQSVGYYVGDTETTKTNGENRVLFDKENELYKNKEVEGFNPNLLMQSEENEFLNLANQSEVEVCIGMLSMVGCFKSSKMNEFIALPSELSGHMVLSSCIQGLILQLCLLPTSVSIVDFYNLDFDGVFIIKGLEERGFRLNKDYYNPTKKKIEHETRGDKSFSYDCIIKDKRIYEIKINLPNQRVVYIRDLMKVSGGQKLSKTVKDFTGILPLLKDHFKYNYIRKPLELRNEDELNYLKYDTLAFNLLAYVIRVELGITTLTIGSFAYGKLKESWQSSFFDFINDGYQSDLDWLNDNKDYIKWLYDYYHDKLVKEFEEGKRKKYPSEQQIKAKMWNQFKNKFLTVSYDPLTEKNLKNSYKGGHTYKNNEQYDDAISKNLPIGFSTDANSLYPTVEYETDFINVYGNRVINFYPYGQGKRYKQDYLNVEEYVNGTRPVGIAKIKILSFEIKRFKNGNHHVPMLRKTGLVGIDGKEYLLTNKSGNRTFEIEGWFTIAEIEAIKQHYKIILFVSECILFKGSKDLFKRFIGEWYKVKQENEGAVRQLGKLILNSSYGKLGQSHMMKIENPVLENGILKITTEKEEDEYGVSHEIECFDTQGVHNMAMASYITTYARLKKIEVENFILEHGGHVVYGDTDSLYILCKDVNEMKKLNHLLENVGLLDTNESGAIGLWKGEKIFNHYNFVATKKYIVNAIDYYSCDLNELNDESLINTINEHGKYSKICAGLNSKDMIKYPHTFNLCENPKEIHQLFTNGQLFTNEIENSEGIKDPHVYYDRELTNPVVGVFITNKKRNVVGGVMIEHSIYIMTPKNK